MSTSLPARHRRTLVASLIGTGLLLSGCGLESGATPADDGPTTLGFVNGGSTEFHTCLQESIANTARSNFAKLVTVNSHQDAARELANIQDMIARHVDAIILQTVNTTALKSDIAKAKSAHIPIFLTSVSADPSDILGAVVVDLKAVGKLDMRLDRGRCRGTRGPGGRHRGRPGRRLGPARRRIHQGAAGQREGGREPARHVRRREGEDCRREHDQSASRSGLRLRRQRGDGVRRPQGVRRGRMARRSGS